MHTLPHPNRHSNGRTWTLERLRQRVIHSDVLWAAFCGTATWLIAIAFSVACWMALFFFLSLL